MNKEENIGTPDVHTLIAPKMRSNSRQAFSAPRRGERIKASTIRKRAVNDGYKFTKEEA